jgi:NAD+ synthase
VGTGNKSELSVGYFTKYGDGAVDILPLGDLLKTEERELAQELDIPEAIIDKVPSAGLWEGQTDESELGMSYDVLDKTLLALEIGNLSGCDPESVEKVKQMMEASRHKREKIAVFKK